MNTDTPLNRWKERFRCPIHGPLSTHGCVACSAELALRATLAKRRESLKASQERKATPPHVMGPYDGGEPSLGERMPRFSQKS